MSAYALGGILSMSAGLAGIAIWALRACGRLRRENARLERIQGTFSDSLYANERLRRLIDLVPHALLLVNRQGCITLANSLVGKTFGYEPRELLGKPLTLLFASEHRTQMPERLAHLFVKQSHHTFDDESLTCARSDGTAFPVEATVGPVVLDRDTQLLLVIVDITDRKEWEAKLRQASEKLARSNEELEQFAYVVSHDLKEPLRMVRRYTEILAGEYAHGLDDTAKTFLHYATDGAKRMTALIDDLLEYGRVGRGGETVDERVDLNETTSLALHDLQNAIHDAGGEVTCGELPVVLGNPTQLRRLFQNVISNGLKFHGQAPPNVSVRAEPAGSSWHITIQDNGIGIAQQSQARVFELFQRLHTRAEFPGSGLGLAICKKIVERHKGRIWIESEPGLGTGVHFTLLAYPQAVVERLDGGRAGPVATAASTVTMT